MAAQMIPAKKMIHATLDPYAINKDVPVDLAAVGDAGLTLDAVLEEVTNGPPQWSRSYGAADTFLTGTPCPVAGDSVYQVARGGPPNMHGPRA